MGIYLGWRLRQAWCSLRPQGALGFICLPLKPAKCCKILDKLARDSFATSRLDGLSEPVFVCSVSTVCLCRLLTVDGLQVLCTQLDVFFVVCSRSRFDRRCLSRNETRCSVDLVCHAKDASKRVIYEAGSCFRFTSDQDHFQGATADAG